VPHFILSETLGYFWPLTHFAPLTARDAFEKRCQVHHIWKLSNLAVALNNAMEQWSYSNCDVVKAGALTIARDDQ